MKADYKDVTRYLSKVPEHNEFTLHMGCNLASIQELNEALDIMAERTFSHHVNKTKNDFAIWIRASVGDKELADKMGPIRDRLQMKKVLEKRLQELSQIKEKGELNSSEFLRAGVVDFSLGVIIGFVIGMVVYAII